MPESWGTLYKRIAKVFPQCRYVPKPTTNALSDFETISESKLPRTYRDFIRIFGPGELAQRFSIYAPGYEGRNRHSDLLRFNQWCPQPKDRRLIAFCHTISNDIIGWDPKDVCESKGPEYGIYYLPRLSDNATLCATSFADFVHNFCLGMGYFRFWKMKEEWNLEGDQQSFSPSHELEREPKSAAKRNGSKKKGQNKKSGADDAPTASPVWRFEFTDGKSNKFWEIGRCGTSVIVTFGRIGTQGQCRSHESPTQDAAKEYLKKCVVEKIAKGYVKVKR